MGEFHFYIELGTFLKFRIQVKLCHTIFAIDRISAIISAIPWMQAMNIDHLRKNQSIRHISRHYHLKEELSKAKQRKNESWR